MKVFGLAAAGAALLIAGSPAFAQQAAAPAPTTPPAAAAPSSISDEDVAKFAKVLLKMKDLQAQGKGSDQTAIIDAVNGVGLSVDNYNALTTNMRTDSALNERINAAFQKEAQAQRAASNPTPPAGG